jgi:hypothetical protein
MKQNALYFEQLKKLFAQQSVTDSDAYAELIQKLQTLVGDIDVIKGCIEDVENGYYVLYSNSTDDDSVVVDEDNSTYTANAVDDEDNSTSIDNDDQNDQNLNADNTATNVDPSAILVPEDNATSTANNDEDNDNS